MTTLTQSFKVSRHRSLELESVKAGALSWINLEIMRKSNQKAVLMQKRIIVLMLGTGCSESAYQFTLVYKL